MNEPALEVHADGEAWASAAAAALTDALQDTVARKGAGCLAVPGGTTPAPIFRRLSGAPVDWSRIAVTLVDERWVPEDSPDSNARLVRETLLSGAAAAARFLPLRGEAESIEAAALDVSERLAAGGPPDVILLGMGEDGHIASIFPGNPRTPALLNRGGAPACLEVPAGQGVPPPQRRLSLNLPAIAAAELVLLAIRGPAKRAVYEAASAAPIGALRASGAPLRVLWTEEG